MSEISVLAHEYKTASDLSQALNRSLIMLKRARLNLPGQESVTPADLEASRRDVIEILDTVLAWLRPDRPHELGAGPRRTVSAALVARLREQRRGTLEYYVQDLDQLVRHLRTGVPALTPDDLALLDDLAAAADSEASNIFRRMMRI